MLQPGSRSATSPWLRNVPLRGWATVCLPVPCWRPRGLPPSFGWCEFAAEHVGVQTRDGSLMKHTCFYGHRWEANSVPPPPGVGGFIIVAGSPMVCDGDLRTEEQVPGQEFGDAAESRRRRRGCRRLGSALWFLGSPRQAGIWPAFTGHPLGMRRRNPSSGEREPPTRAPRRGWAGFVSGAAPPLPAGSWSARGPLASSDFQMWTHRSHSRGFYLQRRAGLFF